MIIKQFFSFVTDQVRNLITSSTLQINALTAEMKVVIMFFSLENWKNAAMHPGDDTVSRVLHIVTLTPSNTTVAKSRAVQRPLEGQVLKV